MVHLIFWPSWEERNCSLTQTFSQISINKPTEGTEDQWKRSEACSLFWDIRVKDSKKSTHGTRSQL